MTTTIINPTATNSSVKQNVSFTNGLIQFVVAMSIAALVALVNFQVGMLLLGAVLVGGAYIAFSSLQDFSLDFELENDLMTEIVAELEQRNH